MTPSFSLLLLLLLGLSQAHPTAEDAGEEDIEEEGNDSVGMTTRILTTNRHSNQTLLEGDMIIPNTRNAIKCFYESCWWTKGSDGLVTVPYTISSDFNADERDLIEDAMKEFEQKQTCIRFVRRCSQSDYISVENKDGCFSYLGRTGGEQVLSLKKRGCLYSGIIQHELLHALGFQHEQTRSDRDDYVRINWENIMTGTENNFVKQDTNNLNTPYDYSSIMHYDRGAFSSNGKDTITPIKDSNVYIGQRWAMSDWDVRRIKSLYNCN